MKMGLSLLSLFMFLVLLNPGFGLNECPEARCRKHGPVIRFPFRIKDKQQQHCGYPGFDLSCTEDNHTLLDLASSIKLYIKAIDYATQSLIAYDPQSCLPKQFLSFNLPISPFHFGSMDQSNYVVFNCTSGRTREHSNTPCLSVPGYDIFIIPSFYSFDYMDLTSCFKIHNLSSVPSEIFSKDNILPLSWSEPSSCTFCEAQDKYCGFRNNTSMLETECFDRPKSEKGAKKKIVVSVSIVGSFLLVVLILAFYRVYSEDRAAKENQLRIENFLEDYKALKPARYSYADIKRITNEFKDKLGQGAYGTVYRGKLSNEIFVAVKILNNVTGNGEEFINEVGTMGRIHHVNVVRLVGYCADGFRRALVYEYLPNESLEKFISSDDGNEFPLGWEKLHDIALGIAKGIEYLHQGCDQRILHFDIKPHNVLLDDNFNPKISDFGLAKLCSKDQSAVSMTTTRGTMGYIAPEVFSRNFGNVSYKSDVYSFGMVLLEMVGGRKNSDDTAQNTGQVYFPEWAYKQLEGGEELRIRIKEEGDAQIAKKLTIVGLWCIQWHPVDRLSMKTVVQMLEGGEKLTMPPNPFTSSGQIKMNAHVPGRLHLQLAAISETDQS